MLQHAMRGASLPGFADAPRDSQKIFRAVMNAMARPTHVERLEVALATPPALDPGLAAVAQTLADGDAPIWLDAPLAADPAVSAYLRFHTGAAVVSDPAEAAFALVADPGKLPPFDAFAWGTEEYPDRSATIVMAVKSFESGVRLVFEGPGLKERGSLAPKPVPADFAQRLEANRALFPRGVDLIFTCGGDVAALPRSVRLVGG
ncbi:MAG TPA: phosphonate C-P lyase system protein PhnH [Mesorhizobium sp.]|jgi:alpha-D-ribose 1-methylphosphonate 5-triphosphate synthase subunit PhnH|nr:phosphonate C-P lyase system protein PhnH [Mesorhizobium sp.]